MYVMQCVHMLVDEGFTKAWEEHDARLNRIIFIGRGMQQRRKELTEGFMACIAKPLRFEVGAQVLMRPNINWPRFSEATVVKHWDECRAYLVRVHDRIGKRPHPDQELEWAPRDDDDFIKAIAG